MRKDIFIGVVVCFAIQPVVYSAELNKTQETAVSAYAAFAKCFEGLLTEEQLGRYGELLARKIVPTFEGRALMIEFEISAVPNKDKNGKDALGYSVHINSPIGSQHMYYHDNSSISLLFYRHRVGYYVDFLADEKRIEDEVVLDFFPTGQIEKFRQDPAWESTGKPDPNRVPELDVEINWSSSGKILSSKNLQHLSMSDALIKDSKMRTLPPLKKGGQKLPLNLPKTTGTEVRQVFSRLNQIYSADTLKQLTPCFEYPLAKKTQSPYIAVNIFSTGKKASINISSKGGASDTDMVKAVKDEKERNELSGGLFGYFLEFHDSGLPSRYQEGIVENTSLERWEEFDEKYAKHPETIIPKNADAMLFQYYNDRLLRGIEINFHANGRPKNYRTLVRKDRLFGRQIEWNDKGEVISDIDLDIPKEIKEKE